MNHSAEKFRIQISFHCILRNRKTRYYNITGEMITFNKATIRRTPVQNKCLFIGFLANFKSHFTLVKLCNRFFSSSSQASAVFFSFQNVRFPLQRPCKNWYVLRSKLINAHHPSALSQPQTPTSKNIDGSLFCELLKKQTEDCLSH